MSIHKQAGISLVEIMIGTLVGMLIITGVLFMYTSAVKSSSDTLKAAKLNQELNAAMGLMVRDIRRASYYAGVTAANPDNPFTDTSITASTPTNLDIKTTNGPCVLYTYDLSGSGATADTNTEYFGFRLNNGAVEIRTGVGTKTDDCTNGSWAAITDPDIITVNTLTFSTENSKCLNSSSAASPQANWRITTAGSTSFPCRDLTGSGYTTPSSGDVLIETRQVNIRLEGTLATDTAVKKAMRESVRVRNDRVSCYLVAC